MAGQKKTEYVFFVKQKIKISVDGIETDNNYEKAEAEAIKQIKKDIDTDWLELADVNEYADYEKETA